MPRAAGPTCVRPLVPLILAAALAATGCGTERPGATSDATPTSTSTAAPPDPLAGFPLDLGYDDENGDDHSRVEVTDQPAQTAFDLCGRLVWDPLAGTTDLIGVEWRGEAEWSRGRTLVLYPSADDAVRAVLAAREAVAGCPDEPSEADYGSTHTVLDVPLGDESVVWADTYWFVSDGEKLHDTGLTVHHLVRVGRAVLLAYEYGEGNGSDESRGDSIARATELERPVVRQMDRVGR